MRADIPISTVRRLSTYYRVLRQLLSEGAEIASSQLLAELSGVSAAQLRKDLSYFGNFGKRGLGYDLPLLTRELRSILGLDRRWRVGLVGAGNIGSALFAYEPFREQGFDIVALFDSDQRKIGSRWNGVRITAIKDFAAEAAENPMDIVVVAVPPAAAQAVCDRVVAAGVKAILNFAARRISVPPGVVLRNVDMALELEALSFSLNLLRGS